jgi:hypothetical protein
LPIPPTGTETQEPDAQGAATSSVSNKVAETQKPATHSVAETQEPATHSVAETQEPAIAATQEPATAETQEPAADIEIEIQESEAQGAATLLSSNKVAETQEPATHSVAETQEPAIAATQEPATAETQEPAADIEIEIQESEVQGAATLLFLHQEAETQESTTIPAAAPQQPASEAVTATQEPVIPQPEPTMASVLQENEFLKSELEAYKEELARAKEAYEKELNLYTLARTTTLSEGTTESLCKEYMCCQCGDIYYQAGYKVIQVPVTGAPPTPSTFVVKEEPAETQEPAGPPKIKTEPCIATKEAPTFVNKAVQTMPMEEFTPPSQINLPTFMEQSTQTLPHPTTCNAETQTQLWDEQAAIQKWKKEYAATQAKSLQVHRQIWINHTTQIGKR